MKYTEFLRISARIKEEPFHSAAMNPFEVGIQKAQFEQEKLRRLLQYAEQTEGNVAKRKADIIKRQLDQQQRVQQRFAQLMREQDISRMQTTSLLGSIKG